MTPKVPEEKSVFERTVEAARGLREILWLMGLIAAAFGTFVLWVVRPLRTDLETMNRRTAYIARVTEITATLWVEPDSAAHEEAMRRLRDLRRFYQDEQLEHR